MERAGAVLQAAVLLVAVLLNVLLAVPVPVLLALLLAVLLASSLPGLVRLHRLYRFMGRLPGPPALPLIGNLLDIGGDPDAIHGNLLSISRRYPRLARLWCAHVPIVGLFEPEDVETVLGSLKHLEKAKVFYDVVEPIMGSGIGFLPAAAWKQRRKMVASSLHADILKTFVPTFHESAARFACRLEELADSGAVFDVRPMCGFTANFTIAETVLSSDGDQVDEGERLAYVEAMEKAIDTFAYRLWRPWLLYDWVFWFTPMWAEYKRLRDVGQVIVQRIIRNKREALANNKGVSSRRKALLDHMLQSAEGVSLSTQDLIEEITFVMAAASSTSMDSLSFLFLVLAIRPDLQEKLVKELDDVFGGDAERPVEESDLPHLDFTERFVKETLRYFPVAPFFAREVLEDIELPSGYTLPKGCKVGLYVPAVHHSARLFPEPDRFDPDRFLPEAARARHPYAFLPFSAGPRNCVAHRYAIMFLKTQLAAVLRRVEVLPAPGTPSSVRDVPLCVKLALAPAGGALIRVRRRQS